MSPPPMPTQQPPDPLRDPIVSIWWVLVPILADIAERALRERDATSSKSDAGDAERAA
jgi:hypothetical protein